MLAEYREAARAHRRRAAGNSGHDVPRAGWQFLCVSECGGRDDSGEHAAGWRRICSSKQHVVVIPGEAFGAPGYLRISYATSMETIEEGLRRLNTFFRAQTAAVTSAANHG